MSQKEKGENIWLVILIVRATRIYLLVGTLVELEVVAIIDRDLRLVDNHCANLAAVTHRRLPPKFNNAFRGSRCLKKVEVNKRHVMPKENLSWCNSLYYVSYDQMNVLLSGRSINCYFWEIHLFLWSPWSFNFIIEKWRSRLLCRIESLWILKLK